MGVTTNIEFREAQPEDYENVVAFTENTWSDRDGASDYLPRVYHDWIEGGQKRTVVADTGDDIAGLVQGVLLSEYEAWGQGMRVNPEFRGHGIAEALTHDIFDWARDQGATVMRNLVHSWNAAGLGNSRHCGYDPATEFRWANPEPDADVTPELDVTSNVNAAWRFWRDSDACTHLRGLALDDEESWAVSELTRNNLRRAAADDGLFVVQDNGVKATAHKVREYDRETDDGDDELWVEYGVGAWADTTSARALFDAVSADAAARGADKTRVLVPESVQDVSDLAANRIPFAEQPDFVLAADLTSDYRR